MLIDDSIGNDGDAVGDDGDGRDEWFDGNGDGDGDGDGDGEWWAAAGDDVRDVRRDVDDGWVLRLPSYVAAS